MTAEPKACVIGWPAKHSRSPAIHRHWLATLGIPGSYEIAEVPPADFAGFVVGLQAAGFGGGNITLPHKTAAFALCDVRTPAAARLGAVNTLWFENGRLYGDNTDVAGFLAALDAAVLGWDQARRAVILGAGGAARAVLAALRQRGLACTLVNRSREKAEALALQAGGGVDVAAWERRSALATCDLLVNATSLGMVGQLPLDLDLAALPPQAIVCDIVYAPLETPLLAAARARGVRAVDGLGMLLYQAVPGFERWFGVRPAVTPALRAAVEADLARA
jgi:shikimate dehydrogenase